LTKSSRSRPLYFPESPRRNTDLKANPASANSHQGSGEAEYRLYINGHLQFSSRDEFIYHENLVHPAFALFRQASGRKPRRVLILGGGDGLALREARKYGSLSLLILCDLDPEMLRLAAEEPTLSRLNAYALHESRMLVRNTQEVRASPPRIQTINANSAVKQAQAETYPGRPYLSAPNGSFRGDRAGGDSIPATRIIIRSMDAARYINDAPGRFDIIIADFPDPNNEALSKLYSLPFYHNIRRKLSKDGFFVQQSTSPIYAYKAFWAIGRTMMAAGLEALPYHDFVPSFGEWGWWIARAKGSHGSTLKQLYQAASLQIPLRYLKNDIMQANIVFPASFEDMYRESLAMFADGGDQAPDGEEYFGGLQTESMRLQGRSPERFFRADAG
ncbi:MAG: hypothetical protein AAF975_09365, partial [Spirochaetota bacterium]